MVFYSKQYTNERSWLFNGLDWLRSCRYWIDPVQLCLESSSNSRLGHGLYYCSFNNLGILSRCFFVYEVKYAKVPLLPHAVTKNRHMIMILLAVFLGWGSFGIWTFYYMSFQLNLRHYSPVWTGGTYFVFVIFGTIAAFMVALSIKRVGPAFLLCFALVAFDVGSIMFSVLPVKQSFWKLNFGMQAILCFGMDLSFPASSIILSDGLPMEYQGMAGSLVNTVINYSASLCLGMGATVEHQINKNGKDLLKGYRGAIYLGVGLASLGVLISFTYMLETFWNNRRDRQKDSVITEMS